MPSSAPLFSVIVCTYNRPRLLARALESVLAQTLPDFEVVVVDDHSLPPVAEAVEAFCDPRLRYFRQPTNRGVASSTNLGIEQARGRYVAILNDDDCYRPEFLERMARHLRESGAEFAWCGIEDALEGRPAAFERVVRPTHSRDPWARTELLTRVGLGYGFTIARDRLLQVGGLDGNLRSSEDTELFMRLVQQPWSWQSLPECLVRVHRQEQRLTRPSARRIRDLVYVMDKHRALLQAHPALDRHFRLVVGSLYVELSDRAQGRRILWSLARTAPGDLRVWALLVANELGLGWLLLTGFRKLRAWRSRR